MRFVMRSKIHRATVTHADVGYVGSISIDEELLEAAGIEEWEKIHVCLLYTSPSPRDS